MFFEVSSSKPAHCIPNGDTCPYPIVQRRADRTAPEVPRLERTDEKTRPYLRAGTEPAHPLYRTNVRNARAIVRPCQEDRYGRCDLYHTARAVGSDRGGR